MCGNIHAIPRERAMDAIGVAHWQCTDCQRRFVLVHSEPELWTPIYLDSGVRSIQLRDTGSANPATSLKNPMPPPAIDFFCRCGQKITAHSWMYGGSTICPGCKSALFLVLKYSMKRKVHVIDPEYPPKTSTA
jgi:hypothetical protein